MRKILRIAAYVLIGLAFVYIGRALWAYHTWLLDWQASSTGLALILVSILIYGFSGLLLSSAWCDLNRACGQGDFPHRQCIAVYGSTQIAKYVPGNVFHFVGRHAAGIQVGLSHGVLGCSASLEMIALLFSAGLLALFGVLIPESGLLALLPFPLWMVITIVVGGFFAMVVLLPYGMRRFMPMVDAGSGWFSVNILMQVVARHLLFFLVSGFLMAVLTYVVVGSLQWSTFILALSSYPLSWLAGYVMPGASAGIGVREAATILILSTAVLPEQATLIAILMRVVTMLGDLFFYLLAKTVESGLKSGGESS